MIIDSTEGAAFKTFDPFHLSRARVQALLGALEQQFPLLLSARASGFVPDVLKK